MDLLTGLTLVLIAGFLQGSFVLPMTLTRRWRWEHTWATFSLFGMLLFNWAISLLIIPNIISVYRAVSLREIMVLVLFGAGWGVGAILFGLGMEKLGMALGYPIIMGLIASLGSLIPLALFFPAELFSMKGLLVLLGTFIVVAGIILCSLAATRKESRSDITSKTKSSNISIGLLIAIFAGILSCLPNIGMGFGENVTAAAASLGTAATFKNNAVWALFFTTGFIVNIGYCLYLMLKHKNLNEYFASGFARNLALIALMALMWIASFYLYGMGANKLGQLGVVVGWPLFISLSIGVGNLWGLWRGEWKGAPAAAGSLLNKGLLVLLLAVVTIAVSSSIE